MEENYILAKNIAKIKVGEENLFYPLFVLCIYGLLCKFPKYKKIVEDVFLDTVILIGDKTVNQMMRDEGLDPSEFFGLELGDVLPNDKEKTNFSRGISISGNNYVLNYEKEFVNKKKDSYIFCTKNGSDEANLMLTLIHEASHLIKGKINDTYKTYGDDFIGYVIRSGLSIYEFCYYPDTDTYSEGESYGIFDEAINCLQTTDAAREILAIDGIIPDKRVQDFLDIVDKDELSKDMGYEAVTNILEPLWKNDSFKKIIEDNIVDGEIDKIIEEFDNIVGAESFDDLDDLLLIIDKLDEEKKNESIKMQNAKEKVLKITEKFNNKTKCLGKIK